MCKHQRYVLQHTMQNILTMIKDWRLKIDWGKIQSAGLLFITCMKIIILLVTNLLLCILLTIMRSRITSLTQIASGTEIFD